VKGNSKSEMRNSKSESQEADSGFGISNFGPRIFLIGYRCTGKTTVARLLAEKLGWDWVDADIVLEARYGKSIRQIFAEEGEIGFRNKEEQIFAELCQLQRCVVATGGGVILRDVNRQRMRSAGKVVWLTADAHSIWERLQADPATAEKRPPLTVGGLAEIEELLKIREPLYRACADFTISTAGQSTEEIAQQIADKLTREGGGVPKAQRDECP
jgi:shikimate kinase